MKEIKGYRLCETDRISRQGMVLPYRGWAILLHEPEFLHSSRKKMETKVVHDKGHLLV